jgi:hypothetical protein
VRPATEMGQDHREFAALCFPTAACILIASTRMRTFRVPICARRSNCQATSIARFAEASNFYAAGHYDQSRSSAIVDYLTSTKGAK